MNSLQIKACKFCAKLFKGIKTGHETDVVMSTLGILYTIIVRYNKDVLQTRENLSNVKFRCSISEVTLETLFRTFKGLCDDDFVVLGQLFAEIVTNFTCAQCS